MGLLRSLILGRQKIRDFEGDMGDILEESELFNACIIWPASWSSSLLLIETRLLHDLDVPQDDEPVKALFKIRFSL